MAENEKARYDSKATLRDDAITGAGLSRDDETWSDSALNSTDGVPVVPINIGKGTSLLNTYIVESDAIHGGMGKVWRVRHTGWNIDLAMKQPDAKLFQNERQKIDFVHECEAWINLELHQHIVSCYYVREIGGIPSIFSEWMDGGSLKNWIDGQKLYEGNRRTVLERIMDIAIQAARGIHYAHENRLIHQDIKPDNLLLTVSGEVKVADFGISKARALLSATYPNPDANHTMMSGSGYFTREYCSPEQSASGMLTRRTDIYSWAVSVLEMFLGRRPWKSGVSAGLSCEEYFAMDMRADLPDEFKTMLRLCLSEKPEERPHDFNEIDTVLLRVYQNETGCVYPRELSKAPSDTADNLNNRALSFLDLGKPDEAEKCWEQALMATPNHGESLYNRNAYLLQNERTNLYEAVYLQRQNTSPQCEYFISLLLLSQGYLKEAGDNLHSAKRVMGETEDISRLLSYVEEISKAEVKGLCLFTLEDHSNGIVFSLFCPDQRHILLGYWDHTMQLWDIANNRCVQSFEGSNDSVGAACFSPDGTMIASKDNRAIRLWNVATGDCLQVMKGHRREVLCVCFSPDGKSLVSGGRDQEIRVWDLEGNCKMCLFAGIGLEDLESGLGVDAVIFIDNGRYILTHEKSTGAVEKWDAVTGKRVSCIIISLASHGKGWVKYFAFNQSGTQCLVSFDKLHCFDLSTGQIESFYSDHPTFIDSLCFSPDSDFAVTGDFRGDIKIWNIRTRKNIYTYNDDKHIDNKGKIDSISFSADGARILTMSHNGSQSEISIRRFPSYFKHEWVLSRVKKTEDIIRYRKKADDYIARFKDMLDEGDISGALAELTRLSYNPVFGQDAVYHNLKRAVMPYCRLGQIMNYRSHRVVSGENFFMSRMSPDGRLVAYINNKSIITVWDTETKQNLYNLDIRPIITSQDRYGDRFSLQFSHDSKKLACITQAGNTLIWDIPTQKCLCKFGHHSNDEIIVKAVSVKYAYSIKFNMDDSQLFSCYGHSLKIWDIQTDKCNKTVMFPEATDTVEISPNDKIALIEVVSEGKRRLEAWDLINERCVRVFDKEAGGYIRFSPDGATALTGGNDKMIRLWNVDTGECICETAVLDEFRDISFSPDGAWAMISIQVDTHNINNYDGFKSFDVLNGKWGITFRGHSNGIWPPLCYSPDGTKVLSGGLDHVMILWDAFTGEQINIFQSTGLIDYCAFSSDGSKILSVTTTGIMIYDLDYRLTFPGWHDWDDGALPYLRIFLALYHDYTESNFDNLITELQNRGYGWLRPERVHAKLKELSGG